MSDTSDDMEAYSDFCDDEFAETPLRTTLTKRELFAAMAMQGMITAITKFRDDYPEIIVHRPKDIAEISLVYADALIAELNKSQEGEK